MNRPRKRPIGAILAWRNVWNNRRRTILTLLTIMVGSSMIILMRSIQEGTYSQMIEDAVSANTGHIQIHEKGFYENMSIDYAFIPDPSLVRYLREHPSVYAFSSRVHAGGLVSSPRATEGALIQGVDPSLEERVSNIHRRIRPGGRYLARDDRTCMVMGETLAHNLGVKVGDSVSMWSQAFDGSFAGKNFTVAGLFRSGNPEYDRYLMIIPLAQAVETFAMGDYVSSIAIRLKDGREMKQVRNELRALPAAKSLEIMGYDELLPDMMQYIIMDRVSGEVLYWILFLVVAFGVLNTIQMTVYERTREFGIMMAIGTRPGQIHRMVLAESGIISLVGVILGVILGAAISYWFVIHPIDFSGYAKEFAEWGIATTVMPAKLEAWNPASTAIITFVLSLLFTLIPAHRASRLKPIEAIRKL